MSRDRAAYMREYRAKRAEGRRNATKRWANDRIAELEAEVKHLKAELAKRPSAVEELVRLKQNQYSTRPFTPVPKK